MHDQQPNLGFERDIDPDDAQSLSRDEGGVEQPGAPDRNSTIGTTPNEDFVARVAGDDGGGYEGETGAEARPERVLTRRWHWATRSSSWGVGADQSTGSPRTILANFAGAWTTWSTRSATDQSKQGVGRPRSPWLMEPSSVSSWQSPRARTSAAVSSLMIRRNQTFRSQATTAGSTREEFLLGFTVALTSAHPAMRGHRPVGRSPLAASPSGGGPVAGACCVALSRSRFLPSATRRFGPGQGEVGVAGVSASTGTVPITRSRVHRFRCEPEVSKPRPARPLSLGANDPRSVVDRPTCKATMIRSTLARPPGRCSPAESLGGWA